MPDVIISRLTRLPQAHSYAYSHDDPYNYWHDGRRASQPRQSRRRISTRACRRDRVRTQWRDLHPDQLGAL